GDRLYLGVVGSTVVHTAWVRVCEQIVIPEAGPDCRIDLGRPDSIIYDCWTPPQVRGRGIYTQVLRCLAEVEVGSGRDAWVYCEHSNSASRRGIEKAGFRPRYRAVHTHVLRLLRRTRRSSVQ